MDLMGLCNCCGKPGAMQTCSLCGRLVCNNCFDIAHGICKSCKIQRP